MVLLCWHIATAVAALQAAAALAAPLDLNKPLPGRPLPNTPIAPLRRKKTMPPPAAETKPNTPGLPSRLLKAAKAETSTYPTGTMLGVLGVLTGVAVGSASLWRSYHPKARDVSELEDSVYRREFKDELD